MNRAFATVGVVGLALLTVTAPASAANEGYLCHATKSDSNPYKQISINESGLHGHDNDSNDIIPPEFLPGGRNWTATGIAIHANGCEPVTTPPVEEEEEVVTPVVVPEVVTPVVVPEVVAPPVEVAAPAAVVPAAVVPPVVAAPAPKAAPAKAPAAAAPVSQGTNQGYNAQTSVGGNAGDGAPTWLGGLGALLAAGLAVAARRRTRTE